MSAWHPRRVGIFVVLGVVLLVAGVLTLNRGSWFGRKWHYVAWFEGSVNGLGSNSPVKMRGIDIGKVRNVFLAAPGQTTGLEVLERVPVIFEIDERLLGSAGVAPRLAERERLAQLIEDGLRAELKLESFVTGQQYVSLDFRPTTPAVLINDRGIGLPEIPTVAPPLQTVQEDIAAVAAQIRASDISGVVGRLGEVLAQLDTTLTTIQFERLSDRLDETLARVDDVLSSVTGLVASADSAVGPARESMTLTSDRLRSSLDSLDATMRAVRAAIDPGSPLSVRMADSFRELGDAANAMRRLAEYLERNPATLVRGRPKEN